MDAYFVGIKMGGGEYLAEMTVPLASRGRAALHMLKRDYFSRLFSDISHLLYYVTCTRVEINSGAGQGGIL